MLLQLLAVVYDGFEHSERNKFRKLLLHRRRCARRAFDMLLENGEENMRIQHFIGTLQEFSTGAECSITLSYSAISTLCRNELPTPLLLVLRDVDGQ